MKKIFLASLLTLLVCSHHSFGQQPLSQAEAIQAALKNNLMVKANQYLIAYQKELRHTAFDIGKTNVTWTNGQFNSILNDNNYTVTQSIPFPTVLSSQAKLATARIEGAEIQMTLAKNDLVREVRSAYHQLVYMMALHRELTSQDSVFSKFANATQVRYRVGEGTLLEKTTAETQWMEINNQLIQNESDISIYRRLLQTLLNTTDQISPSDSLAKIDPLEDNPSLAFNPQLQLLKQEVAIADRTKRVERNKIFPDIMVGYFSQSLVGFQRVDNTDLYFDKSKKFTGFELGISFPLWFAPQLSRAKASALNQEATLKRYAFFENQKEGELQRAQLELVKNENSLRFYENNANKNADLILRQAQKAFEQGEIGYLEFLQASNQARTIKFKYLETLNLYNQAAIQVDYLTGKF